jgi:hypothetical protein
MVVIQNFTASQPATILLSPFSIIQNKHAQMFLFTIVLPGVVQSMS